MRGLSSLLAVFLLLSFGAVGAGDGWDRGENLIPNSGFETDNVGETPGEWELAKGG